MRVDAVRCFFFFLLVSLWWIAPVSGQPGQGTLPQNSYEDAVIKAFGLDQDLVNGVQYFDRYSKYKGIPYFMSIGFESGELTLQDKKFYDIKLRYDLLSQRVEIEYDHPHGGFNWMVAVTDHIEVFRLKGFTFRKMTLEVSGEKFYQEIRTDHFTCFVHWEKRLAPIQNDLFYSHEFSDMNATCLLELDGKVSQFKNRKGLAELFPEHLQKQVRQLLKQHQFKVLSATPQDMVVTMNAVANLLKSVLVP